MRAIILAAGRGLRLQPLTDYLPKPLVKIQGKTLLDHQIGKLEATGCDEVMINVSWLATQMIEHINAYRGRLKLKIQHEPQAMETGGGVLLALPWLCQYQDYFLVINADIWHDFNPADLALTGSALAQLVLSDQLEYNKADFDCINGKVFCSSTPHYVFTGISCLHRSLFDDCQPVAFPLLDVLIPAIEAGKADGIIHTGQWSDLGTFDRLNKFHN